MERVHEGTKQRREQSYDGGEIVVEPKGCMYVCRGWVGGCGGALHVQVYCIDEFLPHMAVCVCKTSALNENAQQTHNKHLK